MKFSATIIILSAILVFEIIGLSYIFFNNFKTAALPVTSFTSITYAPEAANQGQDNFLPDNLSTKQINMLFFGDIMIDRHVGEKIDRYGLDYLFTKLASTSAGSFFSGYDIVGANLEGAVTDTGEHYAPAEAYDFAFAPPLISELKNYGFNFFAIANNHLADQGERGIIETRNNLDELGYFFAGCRDRVVDECSTDIIEIGDKKVGMAAFSMVYGILDEDKMRAEVEALASSTDFVIVNIHWGVEYEHNFNSKQQDVAHQLIDSGADIIIGHHPHVVQGMEIYNDKPIFYSLGNFIFDQYFSPETQEGLAVAVSLEGDALEFELFPLKSRASQVELTGEDGKDKFLNNFIGWSKLDSGLKEEIKKGKFKI